MRFKLTSFTFSFLVIALACGYEAWMGYQGARTDRPAGVNVLLLVAAAGAFVLFLAAVKQRHQR